jgi:hypothetical protein
MIDAGTMLYLMEARRAELLATAERHRRLARHEERRGSRRRSPAARLTGAVRAWRLDRRRTTSAAQRPGDGVAVGRVPADGTSAAPRPGDGVAAGRAPGSAHAAFGTSAPAPSAQTTRPGSPPGATIGSRASAQPSMPPSRFSAR